MPNLCRPGIFCIPKKSGLTGWRRGYRRCSRGSRRRWRGHRVGCRSAWRWGCRLGSSSWLRGRWLLRYRWFFCGGGFCSRLGRCWLSCRFRRYGFGSGFGGSGFSRWLGGRFNCGFRRWLGNCFSGHRFSCWLGCRFSRRFSCSSFSDWFSGRFRCGFGWRLGRRFCSRLGSGFNQRLGYGFSGGFCSSRFSGRLGSRFGRCGFYRRHFGAGEFFDLLGQGIDLAVQRLQLSLARHAQSRNGTVQALVERFFQLAPGVRNARLGGAGSCLGRFNFFTDSAFGQLLGLFAVLDQSLEVFAAVTANLRVHA